MPIKIWVTPMNSSGCSPIYFADPDCPSCAELAETLSRTDEHGIWIFQGSRESVYAFVDRHHLQPDTIVLLSAKGITLPDVGVFATPTKAILDHTGIVRHVRVGTTPILTTELREFCK